MNSSLYIQEKLYSYKEIGFPNEQDIKKAPADNGRGFLTLSYIYILTVRRLINTRFVCIPVWVATSFGIYRWLIYIIGIFCPQSFMQIIFAIGVNRFYPSFALAHTGWVA
jgi:hypothetical protein